MKIQFYYCQNEYSRNGFKRYGLNFSQQFCEFFSEKFTQLFFNETGLKPSSKVTLAGYKQNNDVPIFQSGSVSKLNLVLWIMPEYNDNISFCWRSKTGKIIKPDDAEFDEADLECWFENLKPAEYWKQVATEKKSHPFKTKNLPFEVKVFDFGVEMEMRLFLSSLEPQQKIEKIVSDTIELYNEDSENNNRNKGVVHNLKILNEEDKLIFRIDTGSAGVNIINDILKAIRKIDEIKLVELDL